MMHKAWFSIEEKPYCFDDFNPIWVRLLGRWQLSNPSDLPFSFTGIDIEYEPLDSRAEGRMHQDVPDHSDSNGSDDDYIHTKR